METQHTLNNQSNVEKEKQSLNPYYSQTPFYESEQPS